MKKYADYQVREREKFMTAAGYFNLKLEAKAVEALVKHSERM